MQATCLWLRAHVGGQILQQYDVTHRFRLKSGNTEELVCGSYHVYPGPREAGRVIPWESRGHCMGQGNLRNSTKALLVGPAVGFFLYRNFHHRNYLENKLYSNMKIIKIKCYNKTRVR
jgi:hypothetical protein